MFCQYCRRLFEFRQSVEKYEPPQKAGLGRHTDAASLDVPRLKIEPQNFKSQSAVPKVQIYEDAKDMFTPKLLWWQVPITKDGLQSGTTHAPKSDCQICDMIFSNVSSSLVEALLKKEGEKSQVAFVYQLKKEGGDSELPFVRSVPESILSIWLNIGGMLIPMIKLKLIAQDYARKLPGVYPSYVESSNTGSKETLGLALSWINHCNSAHKKCSGQIVQRDKRLPTRLIDVGTVDSSIAPHLWIPDKNAPFIPYITLSYRWGMSPDILLTQSSLASLLEAIPCSQLPKTNQDAIHITRFLGIRYLWIDALCIIQDQESDWLEESKKMGDIYKFSYCTISASQATTGSQGCFVDRRPLQAIFQAYGSESKRKSQKRMAITDASSSSQILPADIPDACSPEAPDFLTPTPQAVSRSQSRSKRKRGEAHRGHRTYDSNFGRSFHSKNPRDVFSKQLKEEKKILARRLQNQIAVDPESIELRNKFNNLKADLWQQMQDYGDVPSTQITIRSLETDLWATEVDASPLSKRAWTLQERLLSPRILHFGKSQLFFECECSRACESWPQPTIKTLKMDFGTEKHSRGWQPPMSTLALNGVSVDPLPDHWEEIVELYTDTNMTRSEDKLVAISGVAREILKATSDQYYAGHWGKGFQKSLLWYLPAPQLTSPSEYRAPSWSWASVNGKVKFIVSSPASKVLYTPAATIRTTQTIGSDGQRSSTGQIKDGFCRISTTMRKILRYERYGNDHRLVLSDEISDYHNYIDFFPDKLIKPPMTGIACIPIMYYENMNTRSQNDVKDISFLAGLVVEEAGEFRDEYRRLGVFRISEPSGRSWFEEEGQLSKEITII